MSWYYLNGEKRSGPFSETKLKEMKACGMLADETMVLEEGKEEWQAYIKAFPSQAYQQAPAAPPIPSALKFECPHCQQHISADSSQAGIRAECPTCGGDFVVPQVSEGVETTEPGSDFSGEGQSTGMPASLETSVVSPHQEAKMCNPFSERMKDGSLAMKKGAEILKEGTKVGWSGLKRRSKQVALRARIEKLRQIDLRKAFHTLGEAALKQGILADNLVDQYQEIYGLDARIVELREKGTVHEGETKMTVLKRMGKDTAKAGQAQALTVKREHSITELGRAVHKHKDQINAQDLNEEIAVISNIERQTKEIEEQIRALDDGGKSKFQTLAVAATIVLMLVGGGFLVKKARLNNEIAKGEVSRSGQSVGANEGDEDGAEGKNSGPSLDLARYAKESKQRNNNQPLVQQHGVGPNDNTSTGKSDLEVFGRYIDSDRYLNDSTQGLLKSAKEGSAIAQLLLAGRYSKGEGVEVNHVEAAKWCLKAAEQGLTEAQCQIGLLYALGQGVGKDYEQAEIWLRKAAEKGDAMSEYHLGNLYWEGSGVDKNLSEAVKWFEAAAAQGNHRAQAMLGYAYSNGKGVLPNKGKGFEWLLKSAVQGNPKAQRAVAVCYAVGDGVEQDDVTACMWANLAITSGDESAVQVRKMLAERMSPEDVDEAKRKTMDWLSEHN